MNGRGVRASESRVRVRLARTQGARGAGGERRGEQDREKIYIPYICIRRCTLFSDGCGALEKTKRT